MPLHRPAPAPWRRPLAAASLGLLMLASACAAPATSGGAPPHPGGTAAGTAPASSAATSAATSVVTTASATTLARLMAEVGDPTCSQDSQCRTVAVGSKACGGPERYLAWSTQVSQAGRVKAAAEAHAAARQAEDERSGRISNCMMAVDPGARCVANRCQLGNPAGGGAGALVR